MDNKIKKDDKKTLNDVLEKTEKANENSSSKSVKSAKDDEKEPKKEKEYNHNYGYDDDTGDYKIVVGDHIGYRYEIC